MGGWINRRRLYALNYWIDEWINEITNWFKKVKDELTTT